ncbi:MAG: peptide chain release factor 1 [Planctomycetes bacterium]|nr:peptide chain release factor 1 [Planctomycetota bacterium]
MFEVLERMEVRYRELEAQLADPAVLADYQLYSRLMKEKSGLARVVTRYRELLTVRRDLEGARELAGKGEDPELAALAEAEVTLLAKKEDALVEELKGALVEEDEFAAKNAIIEIRAGTGGDEATLFAADLFRMYTRYADKRGWKVELMDASPSEVGGFKEVVFAVEGDGVYKALRYESGVHRVQRVPETEAHGRIHTSTSTVAVLPEAEEVEIEIKQDDIRIDRFSAGGPGGQHVNKTQSAIRITHLPTGVVVQCQDERSQHKNLARAMRVLRTRLYEAMLERQETERSRERRSQIGTGDRSEKIRTYNFPENRVTDHRIKFTLHRLEGVLLGNLDEVLEAIQKHDKEARLRKLQDRTNGDS